MKKIYEAIGVEKEEIIDTNNEIRAFERRKNIEINDLVMITRINIFPRDRSIDSVWSLNGINLEKEDNNDIIIFEPLREHLNSQIINLSINDIRFNSSIKLSDKAIILISVKRYIELAKHLETRRNLRNLQIRLYEGKEELAIKMLMSDKFYIYLKMDQNGYAIKSLDVMQYANKISSVIEKMNEYIKSNKYENKKTNNLIVKEKTIDNNEQGNYKMITGLTDEVEGDIALEEGFMASTDIGKIRENQEDAVLLIRDKENPKFKMMVVADGMGGEESGEVASDVIVKKLKEWFENLSEDKKINYFNNIENLKEDLIDVVELKIQPAVEEKTWQQGGSTLVCAIIGKNNTLLLNVGDSRAYIVKDKKLFQVSREDTLAQEHLEKGLTPNKEASRFDSESNILLQSIGMDRNYLNHPYTKVIRNSDYDILLLFSDGVTDCLSDENIVTICNSKYKKELAPKIVEKAVRHDSIEPKELLDYTGYNLYIPGGKDNATAAVFINEKSRDDD